MKHHDLKISTRYFHAVMIGCKKSEMRYDDRHYEIGDTITLREGQQELDGFKYTGHSVSARISFIDDFGCQPGYLNLSLSDVGLLIAEEVKC